MLGIFSDLITFPLGAPKTVYSIGVYRIVYTAVKFYVLFYVEAEKHNMNFEIRGEILHLLVFCVIKNANKIYVASLAEKNSKVYGGRSTLMYSCTVQL